MKEFIRKVDDLRKYLETCPNAPQEYKIAVGSLIFLHDNQVILLERGFKARDEQGKLEGVGGSVESGETDLVEALKREILEEIGNVEVTIDELLTVLILPGQKSLWWVVAVYLCRLTGGEPFVREPEKISKIHLLKLSEIPQNRLSYFQKETIKAYNDKYGGSPYFKENTK